MYYRITTFKKTKSKSVDIKKISIGVIVKSDLDMSKERRKRTP